MRPRSARITTPVKDRPSASALTVISGGTVLACLAVVTLATAMVCLNLMLGADGWEKLIILIGMGTIALALLAALPHALMLRWSMRRSRSSKSPWPTLMTAFCAAVPFPVTVLFIFQQTSEFAFLLTAAIAMALFGLEAVLMLRPRPCPAPV